MRKDILGFLSEYDEKTVLKKENALALSAKLRGICEELYEKNIIYEIFEFVCFSYKDQGEVMSLAAKNGNLEVLKFITERGYYDSWNFGISVLTARTKNYTEITEYLAKLKDRYRSSLPRNTMANYLFGIIVLDGKQYSDLPPETE